MDVLEELESIALLTGGGSEIFKKVDALVNHLMTRIHIDPWAPSNIEYDRSIHHNPDAKAWADLFVATFPALESKHDLMLGWFANAMMAMHDHLASNKTTSE